LARALAEPAGLSYDPSTMPAAENPDTSNPFHHAGCLGCGSANPNSIGVQLHTDGDRVVGSATFDEHQEGAPGFVHGGAVATVLDDALGTIPIMLGQPSVTANLNVDYRAPVLLGTTVQISAWLMRREGRKFFVAGELRDGETLIAEATGLFLEVPAEHYERGASSVGRW
jgi:acyl-coenzyme A thioesterase PaaI-like protein